MERTISFPLYALAFIITVAIFAIGVYVGTIVDSINASGIEGDVKDASGRVSSLELLLLSDEPQFFCPVYNDELKKINDGVEKLGTKLTILEEKGAGDTNLKKEFFILEANSYLLSKKINEECGDNSTLILYFYSNKNCQNCREQGVQLSEARNSFNNTRTYSFDGELGSPIVEAFKRKFNVSAYPTIVVGDKVFSGYTRSAEIRQALDNNLNSSAEK